MAIMKRRPMMPTEKKEAFVARRRVVIPVKPGEVMVERRKTPRMDSPPSNAYVAEEAAKINVHQETIARYKSKIKNPKTAIRAHCVECSGGSLKDVDECPVVKCSLYPFRMGTNPFNKKTAARLAREAGDENDDE